MAETNPKKPYNRKHHRGNICAAGHRIEDTTHLYHYSDFPKTKKGNS